MRIRQGDAIKASTSGALSLPGVIPSDILSRLGEYPFVLHRDNRPDIRPLTLPKFAPGPPPLRRD
jgi:hypothetical protein